MAHFLVGVVVGASLAALVAIVLAPSRRVRAEEPLDPDVETQLLLGRRPELEPSTGSSSPPHPRAYDPKDLQALRRLGDPRRPRR